MNGKKNKKEHYTEKPSGKKNLQVKRTAQYCQTLRKIQATY